MRCLSPGYLRHRGTLRWFVPVSAGPNSCCRLPCPAEDVSAPPRSAISDRPCPLGKLVQRSAPGEYRIVLDLSSFQSENEPERGPRDRMPEQGDYRPSGQCASRRAPPPRAPFHRGHVMPKENLGGGGGQSPPARQARLRPQGADRLPRWSAPPNGPCGIARFQREMSPKRARAQAASRSSANSASRASCSARAAS